MFGYGIQPKVQIVMHDPELREPWAEVGWLLSVWPDRDYPEVLHVTFHRNGEPEGTWWNHLSQAPPNQARYEGAVSWYREYVPLDV